MYVQHQPHQQYSFHINELLKTSRPGYHFSHLELRVMMKTKSSVSLKPYRNISRDQSCLISYQKPYRLVTTETIARWIKKVLEKAGINVNVFHAHSARSASTSAAKIGNLSMNTIMDAAGWTNASTFSRLYDNPILSNSKFKILWL